MPSKVIRRTRSVPPKKDWRKEVATPKQFRFLRDRLEIIVPATMTGEEASAIISGSPDPFKKLFLTEIKILKLHGIDLYKTTLDQCRAELDRLKKKDFDYFGD